MKHRNTVASAHRTAATLGAVCALALAGCASAPPNAPAAQREAALRSAPAVVVVVANEALLSITTPKDAVGGGLVASMTKAQELPPAWQLQQRHRYPLATTLMQQQLVAKLRASGVARVEAPTESIALSARKLELPEPAALADLRQRYPDRMVLAVGVPMYGMIYKAMNWQTYHPAPFVGRAYLVDTRSGALLWSGSCRPDNKGLNLEFDIADFQANDGARVKQVIELASRACADELAAGLAGP